jgi:hypothetical protein
MAETIKTPRSSRALFGYKMETWKRKSHKDKFKFVSCAFAIQKDRAIKLAHLLFEMISHALFETRHSW